MQKAIKILSIIAMILTIIGTIVLVAIFSLDVAELIEDGLEIKWNGKVLTVDDTEEIKELTDVLKILKVVFIISCVIEVVILAVNIIVASKQDAVTANIVMGIINLIVGSKICGVLFIVLFVMKKTSGNTLNQNQSITQ